jgi:hypothetical protein
MGNEAGTDCVPNCSPHGTADSSRYQCLKCEDRKAVTAANAADSADGHSTADGDQDAQGRAITAFDDFASDESDQQTDDEPTSDDNDWHGLLQKGESAADTI